MSAAFAVAAVVAVAAIVALVVTVRRVSIARATWRAGADQLEARLRAADQARVQAEQRLQQDEVALGGGGGAGGRVRAPGGRVGAPGH